MFVEVGNRHLIVSIRDIWKDTLMSLRERTILIILFPLVVYVFKIESMNMTRQITQDCKENVDTQIHTTSRDQEDSEWGDEDLLIRLQRVVDDTVMRTTSTADKTMIVGI
jgi:hypothetical protein